MREHSHFFWPCVKTKEKWIKCTQRNVYRSRSRLGAIILNIFFFFLFILTFFFFNFVHSCSCVFGFGFGFVFGSLSSHSLQIFLSFCITSTFHFRLCMRKREPRKRQQNKENHYCRWFMRRPKTTTTHKYSQQILNVNILDLSIDNDVCSFTLEAFCTHRSELLQIH